MKLKNLTFPLLYDFVNCPDVKEPERKVPRFYFLVFPFLVSLRSKTELPLPVPIPFL